MAVIMEVFAWGGRIAARVLRGAADVVEGLVGLIDAGLDASGDPSAGSWADSGEDADPFERFRASAAARSAADSFAGRAGASPGRAEWADAAREAPPLADGLSEEDLEDVEVESGSGEDDEDSQDEGLEDGFEADDEEEDSGETGSEIEARDDREEEQPDDVEAEDGVDVDEERRVEVARDEGREAGSADESAPVPDRGRFESIEPDSAPRPGTRDRIAAALGAARSTFESARARRAFGGASIAPLSGERPFTPKEDSPKGKKKRASDARSARSAKPAKPAKSAKKSKKKDKAKKSESAKATTKSHKPATGELAGTPLGAPAKKSKDAGREKSSGPTRKSGRKK